MPPGAEYAARLSSGMAAALGRLKDLEVEARDTLALELQQSADCLDQAARMAMAALLQVGKGRGGCPAAGREGRGGTSICMHFVEIQVVLCCISCPS